MTATGIPDYDTLIAINTPSNSILAIPIKYGTKRWGVIVFDHTSQPRQQAIKFKEKFDDNSLNSYQKIVQFTSELIR